MATTDPMLGTTLADRYTIQRAIGAGRTGKVYVASDPTMRRRVALKVLHPPLCAVPEQLARFEREFSVASRIEHPNSVRMLDFAAHGPHRFLVMELVEGRRLDAVLASAQASHRRLAVRRAARFGAQIARALAAAHDVGVLHRDLNPTNVMICKRRGEPGEQARVLDFGLARLMDDPDDLTATGQRMGREHYMSPEHAQDGVFDARSDLYALGCVLYEMVTGHPPFVGPSLKVLEAHLRMPVPAPSDQVPNLPAWFEDVVLQLLAKRPADRPRSAREVAERLENGLVDLDPGLDEASIATSSERSLPATETTGLGHATRPEQAPDAPVPSPAWPEGRVTRALFVIALLMMSTTLAAGITWIVLEAL